MTSTYEGAGVSVITGRLPPSCGVLRRIDLDVIGGGAGALRHAGNRGALHRIVARGSRRR